ncbi:MBL fold metallo-hydrolase [Desulfopila sp. IMCC35006]|uniref:MBL fold metallo-hydrolase n=1 Tax=Desulfopila sp. IMCC35006 TaxID=2569542 RepID=UPI0010ACCB90|nr:MBL fold metallo-hydrolase [Desulfopila sp. IMCC35006]TKB28013.1 MBL fold metallo-hydrolase [Desulfopila sp. IMCC35006]
MSIFTYTATELYAWLTSKKDIVVLDVRNKVDFGRFKVEAPYPFTMQNISYFDFMEIEEECVAKVIKNKPVRIVCAKEGSAKFVAEILDKHGIQDVGYLEGGIKSWGNLLVPVLLNPGEPFQLYQFIRPGKASASYGLQHSDELMLFDPTRNIDFYLEFARQNGCTLIKTFETHLQADYIAGSRMLSEKTGAEFLANENDFAGANITYTHLQDGAYYSFSRPGPTVQCIFTPGHTPGSTSYIIDNRFMITGDTMFIQSIGRPDLGGQVEAWSDKLFETLQKVRAYNGDMVILPGHYMSWEEANDKLAFASTLAETMLFNKAIYAIKDKADFLRFIKSNMRKQPDEYAMIRRINANLEKVDDEKAEELDLGKNECAATAYAAKQNAAEATN